MARRQPWNIYPSKWTISASFQVRPLPCGGKRVTRDSRLPLSWRVTFNHMSLLLRRFVPQLHNPATPGPARAYCCPGYTRSLQAALCGGYGQRSPLRCACHHLGFIPYHGAQSGVAGLIMIRTYGHSHTAYTFMWHIHAVKCVGVGACKRITLAAHAHVAAQNSIQNI